MQTIFYNTQHSPIGSFASFTLGAKGQKGGLGLELGKPADQNVFIGLEDTDAKGFSCLPFFNSGIDDLSRFNIELSGNNPVDSVERLCDVRIGLRIRNRRQ